VALTTVNLLNPELAASPEHRCYIGPGASYGRPGIIFRLGVAQVDGEALNDLMRLGLVSLEPL
jgi:hypothetical protein